MFSQYWKVLGKLANKGEKKPIVLSSSDTYDNNNSQQGIKAIVVSIHILVVTNSSLIELKVFSTR